MTMTGQNATQSDEFNPERLVDETISPHGMNMFQEAIQAVKNLILPTHKELLQHLRQPTPQKISRTFTTDATGTLGGGLTNPLPALQLYQAPVSAEAWINRITLTAPGFGPANPLKTGEIVVYGSLGETLVFFPQNGVIAPVQIVEGKHSAPHLNSGESALVVGDSLPANTVIRFDLQLILITDGISGFTPKSGMGEYE